MMIQRQVWSDKVRYLIAEENGAETLASASVKAADALIAELNKKKDE